LQDKSETQGTLKGFLRRAQNEFELKVKKIRSDNGSEFKNLQMKEYLEEEGIKHEFSAPYTPQQNGVVERKNRTLIVTPGFRRQTKCEPCTCQDQLFTYTAVT
jgi:transposase InsO family protein